MVRYLFWSLSVRCADQAAPPSINNWDAPENISATPFRPPPSAITVHGIEVLVSACETRRHVHSSADNLDITSRVTGAGPGERVRALDPGISVLVQLKRRSTEAVA
jgi:hypothetical protein